MKKLKLKCSREKTLKHCLMSWIMLSYVWIMPCCAHNLNKARHHTTQSQACPLVMNMFSWLNGWLQTILLLLPTGFEIIVTAVPPAFFRCFACSTACLQECCAWYTSQLCWHLACSIARLWGLHVSLSLRILFQNPSAYVNLCLCPGPPLCPSPGHSYC